MLSALVLALGATPAHLQVGESPREGYPELAGLLIWRLVEAGHPVVPEPSPGAVTVWLHADASGDLVVTLIGATRQERRVSPGPPAVVSLEVLQVAALGMASAVTADASVDPVATASLAVELRVSVDDALGERRLSELLVGLLDRGVALTPANQAADRRVLCVRQEQATLVLGTAMGEDPCPLRRKTTVTEQDGLVLGTAMGEDPCDEQDTGGTATAAMALLLGASAPRPEPSPVDEPERAAQVAVTATDIALARWTFEPFLEAGAIGRVLTIDPGVRLGVRASPEKRWSLELASTLTASSAEAAAIREGAFVTGVAYRLLEGAFRLSVAAQGGVWVHTFDVEDDRGSRVDWTVESPTTGAWAVTPTLELRATLLIGLTGARREHRVADESRWSREALRVGLLAGAGIVF